MDIELPRNVSNFVVCLMSVLGSFTMIGVVLPWFFIVMGPILWYYWRVQDKYRPLSRDLQRIGACKRARAERQRPTPTPTPTASFSCASGADARANDRHRQPPSLARAEQARAPTTDADNLLLLRPLRSVTFSCWRRAEARALSRSSRWRRGGRSCNPRLFPFRCRTATS